MNLLLVGTAALLFLLPAVAEGQVRSGSRLTRSSIRVLLCTILVSAGLTVYPVPAFAQVAARSPLRITSERALPESLRKAIDVRWATDQSVFLALLTQGVAQAPVQENGPAQTEMIPGMYRPGGFWLSSRLAASPLYLVASAPGRSLTWKSLATGERIEDYYEFVVDLDVTGDRILLLGAVKDEKGTFSPDGAIAWVGTIGKKLSGMKPLLYDAAGRGAPNLNACATFEMGAVRFLPNGSFIVVPGAQPGAHLFNSGGKLIRTWDTGLLGIDTDCHGLRGQQMQQMAVDYGKRAAWLNQRRTLEDILPLPEGPGLIVRKAGPGKKVSWELIVLGSGQPFRHTIPIVSQSELDHLKGDVRGDRIVFLVSAFEKDGMRTRVPRLVSAKWEHSKGR